MSLHERRKGVRISLVRNVDPFDTILVFYEGHGMVHGCTYPSGAVLDLVIDGSA